MSTLNDAKGEIQRADHLLFVTLKYTRTIDVMKSVIARLANAYDNAIIHALEVLKKKKKFKQIPLTPVSRAELLRDLYKKDIIILDAMNTYFFLRKVAKAEYNEEVIEVNIKVLEEYYNKTKEFIDYINEKFK